MDNLLTLAFEAHHPERNHHRRYEVSVGRDLLEDCEAPGFDAAAWLPAEILESFWVAV